MKQLLLGAALVGTGTVIGALSSDNTNGTANAQFCSTQRSIRRCTVAPTKVR